MNLGKITTLIVAALLLASCNSTDSALDVEGAQKASDPAVTASPSGTTPALGSTPAPVTAAPASPSQQASALSATRMQFAPIIGAPVEQVTPLSRRLTVKARERSLTIFPASEKNVTHVLKGYFSLLNEANQLKVVYVFDVLDATGNRLHRIQGQEASPATSATASWESVPASVMEVIADRTIEEFATWRSGSGA
jgi:hypothetical protein